MEREVSLREVVMSGVISEDNLEDKDLFKEYIRAFSSDLSLKSDRALSSDLSLKSKYTKLE